MRRAVLCAILAQLLALSGCSQFMGGLRRDLDDSDPYAAGGPTVGGAWSEKGFLEDDMADAGPYGDRYANVGHSERSPASADDGNPVQGSWISPERAAANRRDAYRGIELSDDDNMPSSSTTPDLDPPVQRKYKNGDRATREDFIDDSRNEGSLWGSDGQTNYYFTRNKVHAVGDIVSVKIEAGLLKDIGSETRRTLTPYERGQEIEAANERLQAKYAAAKSSDTVSSSAAAPDRQPAADGTIPEATPPPPVNIPQATNSDIDTLKSMDLKEGDLMMAEILQRYPNGNYKIRASKKVPYKYGPSRLVTMTAIVRGSDIGDDDTINSGKLYEYRLESLH